MIACPEVGRGVQFRRGVRWLPGANSPDETRTLVAVYGSGSGSSFALIYSADLMLTYEDSQIGANSQFERFVISKN